MKYFSYRLIFIFLFFYSNVFAQNDKTIKVTYQFEWFKFEDSKSTTKKKMILLREPMESLFIWEGMLEVERIRNNRELSDIELMAFNVPRNLAIGIKNDTIVYSEVIGNELHQYQEKLNLDWKLLNDTKTIKGYKCKKATVFYAGREWIAWYALDLSADSGPYKFKGLPGLILEVADKSKVFSFKTLGIEITDNKIDAVLINYFLDKNVTLTTTNQKDLNFIRIRFDLMSLNERMTYMNRDEPGNYSIIMTSDNGGKIEIDRNRRRRNYIEIDF